MASITWGPNGGLVPVGPLNLPALATTTIFTTTAKSFFIFYQVLGNDNQGGTTATGQIWVASDGTSTAGLAGDDKDNAGNGIVYIPFFSATCTGGLTTLYFVNSLSHALTINFFNLTIGST